VAALPQRGSEGRPAGVQNLGFAEVVKNQRDATLVKSKLVM